MGVRVNVSNGKKRRYGYFITHSKNKTLVGVVGRSCERLGMFGIVSPGETNFGVSRTFHGDWVEFFAVEMNSGSGGQPCVHDSEITLVGWNAALWRIFGNVANLGEIWKRLERF